MSHFVTSSLEKPRFPRERHRIPNTSQFTPKNSNIPKIPFSLPSVKNTVQWFHVFKVLNTLLKYSFTRIYNKFSPCPLQKFDRYWLIPFLKPIQVLFPQKVHSKACVEPGFPPRCIKLPKEVVISEKSWRKIQFKSEGRWELVAVKVPRGFRAHKAP